ncbi:MAB_1171c family putative transporter [Kitasatospora sp. NPDC089913]|uniref:MAB_1171c family putative transporter n=1 Tax=Kitasatospora sp. NPDC089913 TaxID=3364080 RepID=UPI0037FEA34C
MAGDLTSGLQLAATAGMWGAVAVRARPALRSPHQRGLWLALAASAVAMTLQLPGVCEALNLLVGPVHVACLVRNLAGLVSTAAVVHFVATTTGRPERRGLLAAPFAAVLITLVVIDVLTMPHPEPGGAPPRIGSDVQPLAYWVLLIGTHLAANAACAWTCWRYSGPTVGRELRLGLRLFGWSAALAGVYWLGHGVLLAVPADRLRPGLRLLLDLYAVLRTAAVLVPTVTAVAGAAADVRTVWRLAPLWRDLVTVVPQVALGEVRPRVAELLRPRLPWRLLAYRKVIETRDAILVLQEYVGPRLVERARAVTAHLPARSAEAEALACVLLVARRNRLAGRAPDRAAAAGTAGPGLGGEPPTAGGPARSGGLGRQLADETAFLVAVARARRSPLVRRFEAGGAARGRDA